jgi:hypothetical protein
MLPRASLTVRLICETFLAVPKEALKPIDQKRTPKASYRDGISPSEHGLSSSELFHLIARKTLVAEAPIYFSCEKGVGVRIWLLMLATMGPSN